MQVRVRLLQLQAGRGKEEQLSRIEKLLADAQPGTLAAVPEYAMLDPTGLPPETVAGAAEPLDGPWVSRLRRIARENGVCLLATLFEKGPASRPYNSVVAIDEAGEIVGVYRKTLLFDALGYRESDYFTPGDGPKGPWRLCGLRVGTLVCFEIRFPELFRYHALAGADLIVVPSAWYRGPGKEEQYRFLAQARAHENTVWIAAPILYGENFTGRSMIVDPYGIVVADAGHGERVLEATVDTSRTLEARSALPLLDIIRRHGASPREALPPLMRRSHSQPSR